MRHWKVVLFFIPWILLLTALLLWSLGLNPWQKNNGKTEIIQTTLILEKVEELGRMELVRFSYREIFDYQAISSGQLQGNSSLGYYEFSPDLKAILITQGEAAGCIDFLKLNTEDIRLNNDTLYVRLPDPEVCYYKLDMEKTRVYDFERSGWWSRFFSDDKEISDVIEKAYRAAERQILQMALQDGILEETSKNAERILRPLLEKISGKKVIFHYRPKDMPLEVPVK